MRQRRRFMVASALGLAGAATGFPLRAFSQQATRLARIVVGFPAGGSNDVIARHLADRLRGPYAPTVIVENKVGAQGRIAVDTVKGAEADGSVILQTPGTILTAYPHVFRKLSYDALRDLTPVTAVCTFDLALVVGPALPVTTLTEFVEWCTANPKKAAFGSPAAGASPHFVGVMFARAAGIELLHVGYKGAAPAVQDLLGGQIPAYVGTLGDVIALHRAGKVRVLGTSGAKRSRFVPEVPSFAEAGFPSAVAQDWYGILLPAKAPGEVVSRLNRSILAALEDPSMQEALARLNVDPAGSSPEAFAERIRSEQESWGPIVKASGFSLDQ